LPVRNSFSLRWLTLVAGLALGLAGLPGRAPGYRSIAADRSGVEREIPVPSARDPVRLRLAAPLRTERAPESGVSFGAAPSSTAAVFRPALAAPSSRPEPWHRTIPTGERLAYFPTGPPLSL
jgi:hypothetical protein